MNNINKNLKLGATGLAQHSIEFGHVFDFENIKIVEKVLNYSTRITAETFTIKIKGDDNIVNKQKDSINFKTTYDSIIIPKIQTLTKKENKHKWSLNSLDNDQLFCKF